MTQAPAAPPPPDPLHVTTAQLAGEEPAAIYRAAEAARSELRSQLGNLEDKRREMSSQLRNGSLGGADRAGVEARISDIDKRISNMETQIATADLAVAKAAGVPGAVVEQPRSGGPDQLPPEPFVLGGIFIVVVLLPISLAFARRIWRRGKDAVVAFPQELADRLNRLDQSVDSIAVEVERIGEGQRFVTRVLADGSRSLGAGAAKPIEVGARDSIKVAREGERGAI